MCKENASEKREKKILETELKITEHRRNERQLNEKKVLENMDKAEVEKGAYLHTKYAEKF